MELNATSRPIHHTTDTALHASCYPVITALFATFLCVNDSLIYKIINVCGHQVSAASFIYPITFMFLDIVTEVYGFHAAKKLIWISVVCNFIFTGLMVLWVHVPSVKFSHSNEAYQLIFKNGLFTFLAYVVAMPVGAFINSYLMSRWKILTRSRYFILRSLTTSAIGELVFSMIAVTIIWGGKNVHFNYGQLIMMTFLTKVIWSVVAAVPSSLITSFLKYIDNIDIYDMNVSYNPFK